MHLTDFYLLPYNPSQCMSVPGCKNEPFTKIGQVPPAGMKTVAGPIMSLAAPAGASLVMNTTALR